MSRAWLVVLAIFGWVQAQPAPVPAPAPAPRAVLDKYCVTCHNERLRTAGLALDRLDITTGPATRNG